MQSQNQDLRINIATFERANQQLNLENQTLRARVSQLEKEALDNRQEDHVAIPVGAEPKKRLSFWGWIVSLFQRSPSTVNETTKLIQ
ncbi:hypothetical protein IM40_08780 [Candidatus Paracaedimonas acanthamoebae]|nr:hypothetical protein IM40_08780 [Candidatus Paracaedimonas acanthamoebae]